MTLNFTYQKSAGIELRRVGRGPGGSENSMCKALREKRQEWRLSAGRFFKNCRMSWVEKAGALHRQTSNTFLQLMKKIPTATSAHVPLSPTPGNQPSLLQFLSLTVPGASGVRSCSVSPCETSLLHTQHDMLQVHLPH